MDDLLESVKETAIKILIDCVRDNVEFIPRVLVQIDKTIHLILIPFDQLPCNNGLNREVQGKS